MRLVYFHFDCIRFFISRCAHIESARHNWAGCAVDEPNEWVSIYFVSSGSSAWNWPGFGSFELVSVYRCLGLTKFIIHYFRCFVAAKTVSVDERIQSLPAVRLTTRKSKLLPFHANALSFGRTQTELFRWCLFVQPTAIFVQNAQKRTQINCFVCTEHSRNNNSDAIKYNRGLRINNWWCACCMHMHITSSNARSPQRRVNLVREPRPFGGWGEGGVEEKVDDFGLEHLQCTINVIRLLTDGGTPFEAMHKKLPIWVRSTRAIGNVGPSAYSTEIGEMKTEYRRDH